MAAWSSIFRTLGLRALQRTQVLPKNVVKTVQTRCMSGGPRIFDLTPSRWQWHKTKDLLHMYVMIGAIPITIGIFCTYVFVGPATLEKIPEGYVPKHWEYYQNPITRFIVYLRPSHQQEYEKYLHHLQEQWDLMMIRRVQKKVNDLMNERKDYRMWYFNSFGGLKYLYVNKESLDDVADQIGMQRD